MELAASAAGPKFSIPGRDFDARRRAVFIFGQKEYNRDGRNGQEKTA